MNSRRIQPPCLEAPAVLVIEIVSPDSQTRDRVHTFAEYEAGGIPVDRLIAPDRRTADFFHRNRTGKCKPVKLGPDGICRNKAAVGSWIDVGWLWPRPLPSTVDVLRAGGIV